MKRSELVLLYQAIQQSNLHPTTKSFLGSILKNMPPAMPGAMPEAATLSFDDTAADMGDVEDADAVLERMGVTDPSQLNEADLYAYDNFRGGTRGAVGSPERGMF